jgi:hypothetical protein
MRSKVAIHPLFSRSAQNRLDERIATGYEKAPRQAAGGVKNSPRKQPLDGIPVAQEKTILSLAVPEGFAAQKKVPSCLP